MGRMKSTEEYPVNNRLYYILYYKNLITPRLLQVYFTSKKLAEQSIREHIAKQKRGQYEVVKGSAIKGELFYYTNKFITLGHEKKYVFPKGVEGRKLQKNYRIIMRRRLKRMGLYFNTKTKGYITDPEHTPKMKIPKQPLRRGKGFTSCRAFTLDRFGDHFIFVLVKISKQKPRGVFKVLKVVKVNRDSGKYSESRVKIYNFDIIRPYLLTEFYLKIIHLPEAPKIIELCEKLGVNFRYSGSKKILLYNRKIIKNGTNKNV